MFTTRSHIILKQIRPNGRLNKIYFQIDFYQGEEFIRNTGGQKYDECVVNIRQFKIHLESIFSKRK